MKQRKKASSHMTIFAPIGGTVIHKNALEGNYIEQGENLYQIADLSTVWVLADIYEHEMSLIKKGQPVEITAVAYPGEKFIGKIAFIDPFLDPQTRSIKVRIDVPNSQFKLKPGMFVDVLIHFPIQEGIRAAADLVYTCPMHPEVIENKPGDCPLCGMSLVEKREAVSGAVLAVPRSAVIDTGDRKIVYIEKEKGIYFPVQVELGSLGEVMVNGQKREFYALRDGLSVGERVVSQANFLIDSQSQITGQAKAVYSGAIESDKEDEELPSTHIH
jgi:Cu(I)/Ag(I) efflux system membrane fusion protein